MKKALIVLLSLAVVGAVFAQEGPSLTFGGSLQTGIVYQMGDNVTKDGDPSVFAYADDAGKNTYRLRLNGDYVNGNTGAKFRLESYAGMDVDIAYAWTYVDLLDSMVHIDLGYKIDDNAWRTKGDDEIDYDADGSVKVQIKPIEGLNLGFTVGFPTAELLDSGYAYETDEDGVTTWTKIDTTSDVTGLEIGDLTYIGGFAYAMAPIGVQGGFKAELGELVGAYAGFDYADVIPGLSVYVEGDFQNLNEFKDLGVMKFSEKVKYVTGPIEAALVGTEWLYQMKKVDMGLKVKGSVSYAAGNIKPAIEVVYNNAEIEIDKFDWQEKDDTSTLTIKPTVEVKFTDKTKVVSGYEFVSLTDMVYANTQKLFVNFRYDF